MSFVRSVLLFCTAGFVASVALSQPIVATPSDDATALRDWPVAFGTLHRAASGALNAESDSLPSAASHFIAMAPCRVYDSRVVAGGPGPIPSATSRTVAIAAGPCPGIPSNAAGFSLNITVTGSVSSSSYAFLTAYPTGTTRPNAATLNFKAGSQVGNAAIVPSGTGGAIDVYVSLATEVIVDINGYFAEGVVTSVIAGTGLSGGGSGGVNLSIADGGVGLAQLSATGSTTGQVLSSNGSTVEWQNPASASGTAGGDLTGSYPNPAVATVGGQTASFVAAGAALANAATSAETPGAIVKRDVFGTFATKSIALSGNLTLPATNSSSTGVIATAAGPFVHFYGTNNVFFGTNAGNFTMTGSDNTGLGAMTLVYNEGGTFNTAAGRDALYNNTSGNSNTAAGYLTMYSNTTGAENVAVGSQVLTANATGSFNTAAGTYALFHNTDGSNNTALGYNTLINTTGSYNIALGWAAGGTITTGQLNIDIGNVGDAADSNTIRIGSVGWHNRTFIAGITGVTTAGGAVPVLIDASGQLGTASSSRRYKFDIDDMGITTGGLMRLRPVTFRYLAHGENAPLQYGLIAEEVAEVYPEMVTRDEDGRPETVMYQFLAPMLLNELQKEHRRNEEQQTVIDALQKTIDSLARRLERLESRVK